MTAAFKRGKRLYIYVPTRTGFVERSTGTSSRVLVRKMKAMVQKLRDDHDWKLLDAIRAKRLTLGELYDHYSSGKKALKALRKRLAGADKDICYHLDAWEASVRATLGDTGTASMYRWQVGRLTGEKMLASELTPVRITAWLASLEVTPGTARKPTTRSPVS